MIEDLGQQLSDNTGLFVYTTQDGEQGNAYYAVTLVSNGIERPLELLGDSLTLPVQESVQETSPILVNSVNNGLGRVYTHFMDYKNWNPTFQGYAYDYAVALPYNYDPSKEYSLLVELHAYTEYRKFLTEAEYDWQTIQLFVDDPGGERGSVHSWWYGFAADHNYNTDGPIPVAGTIENFTEQRVLQAIDELIAQPDINVDPARIVAFGHSMGGSGALSLGIRYGNVFAASYSSEPMTDYGRSPGFQQEFEQLWGSQSDNLLIVNGGPHADIIAQYGAGETDPTGVWDWMDHGQQLERRRGEDTAYLMFGHGKSDTVIDWQTQGQPFVASAIAADVGFSAELRGGWGHSWMGFGHMPPNLFLNTADGSWMYESTSSFLAIANADNSGSTNPANFGTDRYNLDIEWSTSWNSFHQDILDTTDRYEVSLRSLSGNQTADITPRNLQKFTSAPGQVVNWQNVDIVTGQILQQGQVVTDSDGLVTVAGFSVVSGSGSRLVLTTGDLNAPPPPLIRISDASVVEGDSGTKTVNLVVSIDKVSDQPVSANFSTRNGSAASPGDYLATSGTILIAPGQTAVSIPIEVVGDELLESEETFSVTLTDVLNASPADTTGVITIIDSDSATASPPSGETDRIIAFKDTVLTPTENQNANLGGAETLAMYIGDADGRNSLLQFDVSQLSTESLTSAVLQLTQLDAAFDNDPIQISIYAVDAAWSEGNGTDPWAPASEGATWNQAGGGSNWLSSGGDFNTSYDFGNGANGLIAARTLTDFEVDNNLIHFDVTSAVRAWLDGSLPNHGLALVITQGNYTEYVFASSESPLVATRPALLINSDILVPPSDPTPTDPTPTDPTPTDPTPTDPTPTDPTPTDPTPTDPTPTDPTPTVNRIVAIKDAVLTGTEGKNANLGGADVLALFAAEGNRRNALVQFDVSALSMDDINSVDLELTQLNGDWDNDPIEISVYAIASDWSEGNGTDPWAVSANGASWNQASNGTTWTTPGGDLNRTYDFGFGQNGLIDSRTLQGYDSNNPSVKFDVTAAVQAWLTGSLPNHGLALVITQGNYSEYLFASKEASNTSTRPALILNAATDPTPTDPTPTDPTPTDPTPTDPTPTDPTPTDPTSTDPTPTDPTPTDPTPADPTPTDPTPTDPTPTDPTPTDPTPTDPTPTDPTPTDPTPTGNRIVAIKDAVLTGTEGKNANLGGADVLALFAAEGNRRNALVQFDVSALSIDDINSVDLELTQLNGDWDNDPIEISVYAIASDWSEGNGTDPWAASASGASWNQASNGTTWTTPGGDLNRTYDFGLGQNGLIDSRTLQGYDSNNPSVKFDVTAAVQAWLTGSLPNHGLALVITQGNYSEYLFASKEASNTSIRPALILNAATDPTPTDPTPTDPTPTVPTPTDPTPTDPTPTDPTPTDPTPTDPTPPDPTPTDPTPTDPTPTDPTPTDPTPTDPTPTDPTPTDPTPTDPTPTDPTPTDPTPTDPTPTDPTPTDPTPTDPTPTDPTPTDPTPTDPTPTDPTPTDPTPTDPTPTDPTPTDPTPTDLRIVAAQDTVLTGTENRNANLGGAEVLALYAAEGGRRNGLLKFELPGLPSADMTSATLELTQLDGEWDNDPIQISLFAVSSAWFEGTGTNPWASSGSGATWNRADTGSNWATPGGDLNTTYDFGNGNNGVIASQSIQGYDAENNLIALDVTAVVRAWLDGSLPNYGIAIVITQGNYSEYLFASSETSDDSLKPALVIRSTN